MISLRLNITISSQYLIYIIFILLCVSLFSSGCSRAATPIPEKETLESISPPTKTATEETTVTSPPESMEGPTPEQPRGGIGVSEPIFSSSTYSKEVPDNIMKEIGYFERGGGGDPYCDMSSPELVHFHTYGNFVDYEKGELYQPTYFFTCGWNRNEKVQISVNYPDGRVRTYELYPDEDTVIEFSTEPDLGDIPGRYQVIMEGSSGRIEASYELIDLGQSGLSQINDRILLYHFEPKENVNIYAYRIHGYYRNWREFIGWQVYQVDPDGKLKIQISPEFQSDDIIFMALGDVSGVPKSSSEPTCDNAPPQRVKIGSQARTITNEIPYYTNYEEFGNFLVRSFPSSKSFSILDGPVCDEWVIFWFASFEDGSLGWIGEGKKLYDDGTLIYYIEPYDTQSQDIITTGCPDAPPQRVQVGDSAIVCTKNDRLIVREDPRRKAAEITRIEPGTQVRIIDGPECANKWSWWKIETDKGVKGWVSEGGDKIDPYYICPLE